jgi:predicted porin
MKRYMFLAVFALVAGIALPAFAALPTAPVISGNVSLSYWAADASEEGDSINQNFFPCLTAQVNVADNWSAIGEYSDSSASSEDDGSKDDSKYYKIGARYDFDKTLWYATLSWDKLEMRNVDGATTLKMSVDGIRLGGGLDYAFEASPWSVNWDLGLGIANGAKATGADGMDGDEFDTAVNFAYKFKEGFTGNLGYRYMKLKLSSDAGSATIKVDGPVLGVGYDF